MSEPPVLSTEWFAWEVAKSDDATVRSMATWARSRIPAFTVSLSGLASLPNRFRYSEMETIAKSTLDARANAAERFIVLSGGLDHPRPTVVGYDDIDELSDDLGDEPDDEAVIADWQAHTFRLAEPVDDEGPDLVPADGPDRSELTEYLRRAIAGEYPAATLTELAPMDWRQMFDAVPGSESHC
jgi:hypothetical protein